MLKLIVIMTVLHKCMGDYVLLDRHGMAGRQHAVWCGTKCTYVVAAKAIEGMHSRTVFGWPWQHVHHNLCRKALLRPLAAGPNEIFYRRRDSAAMVHLELKSSSAAYGHVPCDFAGDGI